MGERWDPSRLFALEVAGLGGSCSSWPALLPDPRWDTGTSQRGAGPHMPRWFSFLAAWEVPRQVPGAGAW